MNYIEFKIGEKELAIEVTDEFTIEPTLINKIAPTTINIPHSELIDGLINYRGKMVDVVDIAPLYQQEKLKKFDGLLFISNKDISFALKYEGFHKINQSSKNDILDINSIIQQF